MKKSLSLALRSRIENDLYEAGLCRMESVEPFLTVLKRSSNADAVGNGYFAVFDQRDRLFIFGRCCVSACDLQFVHNDRLQGNGNFLGYVADLDQRTVLSEGQKSVCDGLADADSFEGKICAAAVCQFLDLRRNVFSAVDYEICAVLAGQFLLYFIQFNNIYLAAACGLEDLEDHEADNACAEYNSSVVDLDVCAVYCVASDRQGLDERAFVEADAVRHGVNDIFGNDDIFTKRAGTAIGFCLYAIAAAVVAYVLMTGLAGIAISAVPTGVEYDTVANFIFCNALAHCGNNAGRFVTHDHRGDTSAGAAVIAVYVGTADGARLYVHLDLAGTGERSFNILINKLADFFQYQCFHFSFLLNLYNDRKLRL